MEYDTGQRRSQKFFEGRIFKIFVWKNWIFGFFLKNPRKLKNFFRREGYLLPNPPSGYAPDRTFLPLNLGK